jgi:hypothetical protein
VCDVIADKPACETHFVNVVESVRVPWTDRAHSLLITRDRLPRFLESLSSSSSVQGSGLPTRVLSPPPGVGSGLAQSPPASASTSSNNLLDLTSYVVCACVHLCERSVQEWRQGAQATRPRRRAVQVRLCVVRTFGVIGDRRSETRLSSAITPTEKVRQCC